MKKEKNNVASIEATARALVALATDNCRLEKTADKVSEYEALYDSYLYDSYDAVVSDESTRLFKKSLGLIG